MTTSQSSQTVYFYPEGCHLQLELALQALYKLLPWCLPCCLQVASHLDALGWEQSAPGDNQTAQYWQFTPQDDNGDITSVTSHRSNDADLASDSASQLRTPARRSEQPGRPHQQHTPLTNDGLQADSRLSVLSDSCPQDGSSPLHADSPPPERNEASLVCEEHHHYVQPHSQQRQQQRQVLPYQSGQLAQQMDHEPAYRQHASQPQQEMQIQQSLPAGPQLLSQPPSMAWQRIPTPELSSAAEPTLAKLPLPASYRTAAASLSGKAVPQHQLPEPAGKAHSIRAGSICSKSHLCTFPIPLTLQVV